ncbi:MAG TPA: GT-D fold domain-containing glycosyltransferase [Bacilli bacterium]|nr:GT-D fold domain-containing glycosyltransferase [Bacilli bacterium]
MGKRRKGRGKYKKLHSSKLMDKILDALDDREPLSVVNVGATESFVMAQYTVLSEEEFMNHDEAKVANRGAIRGFYHRGITFPNIEARDMAVEAVRNADIVGYNTIVHTIDGGLLTEKVFEVNNIWPRYVFEGYIRRVLMLSQQEMFEEMLEERKILLVSSIAEDVREAMNQKKDLQRRLGYEIVGAIPIWGYDELEETKKKIDEHEFDLCLLAAGTNALMLADHVKRVHGKVAFDIGFGMETMITGEVFEDGWLNGIIGLDRLMKM